MFRTVSSAPLVVFSACPAFVEWEGELHRTGHYPDPRPGQTLTVTKAMLDTWVRNFQPAPAKIQHADTPLDPYLSKFGLREPPRVEFAGLDAIGQPVHVLKGKARVPAPLVQMLGDHRAVSLGIEPDGSRIRECSFAIGTRVPTALLFAEQAAAAIADYVRDHPDADLEPDTVSPLDTPAAPAIDLATADPAQNTTMTLKELLSKLRGATTDVKTGLGLTDAQIDALIPADPVATPPAVVSSAPTGTPAAVAPTFALPPALAAEIEGLKNAVATGQRQNLNTQANAFYADLLRQGKATPAMQAGVVAEFSAAVIADGAGTITFSSDGAPTEGDFLKAIRGKYKDGPVFFSTQLQVAHVADATPTDAAAAVSDADLAIQLGITTTN